MFKTQQEITLKKFVGFFLPLQYLTDRLYVVQFGELKTT